MNNLDAIAEFSAGKCGCSVEEMKGHERLAHIVKARHMTSWLARHLTVMSYTAIARQMNRDHTSIIHGHRKFADEADWAEMDELLHEAEIFLKVRKGGIFKTVREYREKDEAKT